MQPQQGMLSAGAQHVLAGEEARNNHCSCTHRVAHDSRALPPRRTRLSASGGGRGCIGVEELRRFVRKHRALLGHVQMEGDGAQGDLKELSPILSLLSHRPTVVGLRRRLQHASPRPSLLCVFAKTWCGPERMILLTIRL